MLIKNLAQRRVIHVDVDGGVKYAAFDWFRLWNFQHVNYADLNFHIEVDLVVVTSEII